MHQSRRDFLKAMSMTTGALMLPKVSELVTLPLDDAPANFTLRIKTTPIEIAKNRILSMTTYNGQFPGPLLRLKEGERTTIDIFNDTDVPEQFHWHGQFVPVEVDGAAEQGTPFIPAHGMRRIVFTPSPAGVRVDPTNMREHAYLSCGAYRD